MDRFDVIVVGAGPAGGQCARELAAAGKNVLLAERHRDFTVNNYSSGGAPLEVMDRFQLPESIVGSSWNRFVMHSSNDCNEWSSPERRGIVADFGKLRAFLARETANSGGKVQLGFTYQKHEMDDKGVAVWFKDQQSNERRRYHTRVLVDATGSERQILGLPDQKNSFPSTGIEYLVNVQPDIYKRYAHTLSLFMGHQWVSQGYAWIFPMEPNLLKVGMGRYFQNDRFVPHEKSYRYYLNRMLEKCLGGTDVSILDKHGKTLIYTYRQQDPHHDRCIIAIGDSVSTLNPLALEGIRHAMMSGRIASKHILDYLEGTVSNFDRYVQDMRRYFGWKWRLCEWLMKIIYREPKDEKVDAMLRTFKHFSFDDMMHLGFDYHWRQACKFLFHYNRLSLSEFLKTRVVRKTSRRP
ncbi:MAG: NAD(P)/FAD-dependent oxidoreductase [Waddliaceae bacterium]